MLPNAWFYKLKDNMSRFRTNNHNTKPRYNTSSIAPTQHLSKLPNQPYKLSDQRKSYYFTRELTDFHPNSPMINAKIPLQDSPRRSSCHRRRKSTKKWPNNRVVSPSISASCTCQNSLLTNSTFEESYVFDRTPPEENDSPGHETTKTLSLMPHENDDSPGLTPVKTLSLQPQKNDSSPSLTTRVKTISLVPQQNDSSPGLTTPVKTISFQPHQLSSDITLSNSCQCEIRDIVINDSNGKSTTEMESKVSEFSHLPPIITKKQDNNHISRNKSPAGRFSKNSTSPGMKLRMKIGNRRIHSGRKSVSSLLQRESLAVVKSSEDPGRDFKESMVEMIMENNIKESKDLEELLACYLLMNSDEYHEIIINVFKQIWLDFVRFRLK